MDRVVLDAIHLDQLREHGGLAGVRDENVLESAIARPKQKWHYGQTSDLRDLAAAYGWGLATSHPYRDGNKRIAFLTMATFLELNGARFQATEAEVVEIMLAIASGKVEEAELSEWLKARVRARA